MSEKQLADKVNDIIEAISNLTPGVDPIKVAAKLVKDGFHSLTNPTDQDLHRYGISAALIYGKILNDPKITDETREKLQKATAFFANATLIAASAHLPKFTELQGLFWAEFEGKAPTNAQPAQQTPPPPAAPPTPPATGGGGFSAALGG